jgi:hypothetical protein
MRTRRRTAPIAKRAIHTTTIVAGITKALNVKNLPNKIVWMNAAEWAYENGFTAEQFLECYGLMKQQHWRSAAITPRSVTENLPELEKLRNEPKHGTRSTTQQPRRQKEHNRTNRRPSRDPRTIPH